MAVGTWKTEKMRSQYRLFAFLSVFIPKFVGKQRSGWLPSSGFRLMAAGISGQSLKIQNL